MYFLSFGICRDFPRNITSCLCSYASIRKKNEKLFYRFGENHSGKIASHRVAAQWVEIIFKVAFSENTYTLYNAILRIARNFLETRENIKISTHPFYHINLGWFSWEWSKKNFFFSKKKFKMADSKRKFLAMRNIALYSVSIIAFLIACKLARTILAPNLYLRTYTV